jgi:hypothetical protein
MNVSPRAESGATSGCFESAASRSRVQCINLIATKRRQYKRTIRWVWNSPIDFSTCRHALRSQKCKKRICTMRKLSLAKVRSAAPSCLPVQQARKGICEVDDTQQMMQMCWIATAHAGRLRCTEWKTFGRFYLWVQNLF